jgi:two-component system OmpR family response regulator
MASKHILIIEDDEDLSELLAMTLTSEGYTAAVANDKDACDEIVKSTPPDLIILDINLNWPSMNGLDFCRELRKTLSIPILILSGSKDDIDKIVALQVGATNYLTKPINPVVLLAFIKTAFALTKTSEDDKPNILYFESYIFNLDAMDLRTDKGEQIPLSPSEFKILKVFVERPKRALSREQLLNHIGTNADIYDRSIDRFISRLRKKIETHTSNPTLIKSVYGLGYIFDVDVRKDQDK